MEKQSNVNYECPNCNHFIHRDWDYCPSCGQKIDWKVKEGKMDIVDQIESASYSKVLKIERLWAVAMLNYRQPLGDKAWDLMRKLTDADITEAISFLTGFAGGSEYRQDRLEELAGIRH